MRYFLSIVLAMFAVACTKTETTGNLQKTDAEINQAADKAGDKIEEAYNDAKPELKELGKNIAEGAKEVGGAVKKEVHEATAPDANDTAPVSQ